MPLPKNFRDLSKRELVRSAVEDFAIDLQDEEKANKDTVIAALAENSIVWEDYVAQHPEVLPDPDPVESTVITSNAPSHGVVGEDTVSGYLTPRESEEVAAPQVHVAQPAVNGAANDQYLLKMTRENPLFQVRGYTFTSEHPYALVSTTDAQYILSNEDGFRQAFPDELAEFYG